MLEFALDPQQLPLGNRLRHRAAKPAAHPQQVVDQQRDQRAEQQRRNDRFNQAKKDRAQQPQVLRRRGKCRAWGSVPSEASETSAPSAPI